MRVSFKSIRPAFPIFAFALAALVPLIFSARIQPVDVNASAAGFVTPTPVVSPSEIDPRIHFAYASFFHDESSPALVTVALEPFHRSHFALFSTSDGTAVGGSSCGPGIDYVQVVGYFFRLDDNTAAQNIPIEICPDGISEPNETINLSITGEVEPPTSAVLTIGDVPFHFSISGQVRTAGGRGIWNAQLRLYSPSAPDRYTHTRGSFGWYTFDDLEPGGIYYVYVVSAPRHTFTNYWRYVRLDQDYNDFDFTADP